MFFTDSRLTALWISKHYPKSTKIADVGSGKFKKLTELLLNLGFECVAYDFVLSPPKEFKIESGKSFDLLVSENSCNATKILIKSAIVNNVDVFFIHCGCPPARAQKLRRDRKKLEPTHTVKYIIIKTFVSGFPQKNIFVHAIPKEKKKWK